MPDARECGSVIGSFTIYRHVESAGKVVVTQHSICGPTMSCLSQVPLLQINEGCGMRSGNVLAKELRDVIQFRSAPPKR